MPRYDASKQKYRHSAAINKKKLNGFVVVVVCDFDSRNRYRCPLFCVQYVFVSAVFLLWILFSAYCLYNTRFFFNSFLFFSCSSVCALLFGWLNFSLSFNSHLKVCFHQIIYYWCKTTTAKNIYNQQNKYEKRYTSRWQSV